MKKIALLIVINLFSIVIVLAQSTENKNSVVQVSFIPPLSTQGIHAGEYTNVFSFNILAGISQNERKFTFGGLVNVIKNDASGVQFAGLANIIGNDANGFQFAGLFNTVGNNGKGFLFSGLFNSSKDYKGFQFAGLANQARDVQGFQFAGIMNTANDVKGFQFGGLANKARNVEGVQFAGILNIADNSDYPIGLLNIIKNGEMGIGVSYNEVGSTMLSFRSGGRVLYGILGVGYNYRSISKESFVIEGGFGAHINCSPSFRINTELKSAYFSSFSKKTTYQQSFSILPAFKLGSNIEVFAGPSVNYMRSDNMDNAKLFPKQDINIWKKFGESKMEQVYVGFSVGTQILF